MLSLSQSSFQQSSTIRNLETVLGIILVVTVVLVTVVILSINIITVVIATVIITTVVPHALHHVIATVVIHCNKNQPGRRDFVTNVETFLY